MLLLMIIQIYRKIFNAAAASVTSVPARADRWTPATSHCQHHTATTLELDPGSWSCCGRRGVLRWVVCVPHVLVFRLFYPLTKTRLRLEVELPELL